VVPGHCAKTDCAVDAAVIVVVTPAVDVVGTVGIGVDALAPAVAEGIGVLVCAVAADVDVDGLAVEDTTEADDDALSAALVLDDDGRDFDSRYVLREPSWRCASPKSTSIPVFLWTS
jgi:hypothetical protein